MKSADMKEIF